jgi:hypothetical protein
MKLTGAAILVSRGMKVLQAAPAAYPYRSAAWRGILVHNKEVYREDTLGNRFTTVVGDADRSLQRGRWHECRRLAMRAFDPIPFVGIEKLDPLATVIAVDTHERGSFRRFPME